MGCSANMTSSTSLLAFTAKNVMIVNTVEIQGEFEITGNEKSFGLNELAQKLIGEPPSVTFPLSH